MEIQINKITISVFIRIRMLPNFNSTLSWKPRALPCNRNGLGNRAKWRMSASLKHTMLYVEVLTSPFCRWEFWIHLFQNLQWVIIGSGIGLAPVWCQAITWTNDDPHHMTSLGLNELTFVLNLYQETWKNNLFLVSFLNTEMVHILEIFPHGRQGLVCAV